MGHRFFVGLLLACALSPATAFSATIAIWPDLDNTLFADPDGAISNGVGPAVFVGRNGAGNNRRGVLAFDVAAAVPAGATIDSATLVLNLSQASNSSSVNLALHRLLSDWGEGTSRSVGGSGGPSTSGDATWIHRYYPSTLWVTPGGDFAAAPSAAINASVVGSYAWSSAALAADVQHWLDHPAESFGWILIGNEVTNNSAKRFDSREHSDPSLRPMLTIEYTPVPEPASAALIALGAAVALGRRRMPS